MNLYLLLLVYPLKCQMFSDKYLNYINHNQQALVYFDFIDCLPISIFGGGICLKEVGHIVFVELQYEV